jgi:hypothetical protein
MPSSDDFREQLKAGNITEALALALSQAAGLKITTWVTSATDEAETTPGKPGDRLRTHINTIEGKLENEIGDRFIGNGPYRELRQFHFDQVAESSKIIQSNLKSLQKLFEVLVALGYSAESPPVVESNSFENQLLPPVKTVTNTELIVDSHDSIVSPNALTQKDIAQEPSLPSEALGSFLATPSSTDSREALLDSEAEEEAEEDDWDDDPILNLLESLPVPPRPTQENLSSELNEDWRDFIVEEPESDSAASDSQEERDWGTLTLEDLEPPPDPPGLNIEAFNAQRDEGREDLVAEAPESHPAVPDLSGDRETHAPDKLELPPALGELDIEASNSQHQRDWGWADLVAEEPDAHPTVSDLPSDRETPAPDVFNPSPASSEAKNEVSTSKLDEDWGDMVEQEPDQPIPGIEGLALEEDDEWDDWVVEEPEPLQDAPVVDVETLDLREDEDWDDFEEDSEDPFTPTTSGSESVSNLEIDEDWDEFAAEELEPYSSASNDTDITTGFDLSDPTKSQKTQPDLATLKDNSADTREEARFTERMFEDYSANDRGQGSGTPKSADKKVPPPPPPYRLPDRNSEK